MMLDGGTSTMARYLFTGVAWKGVLSNQGRVYSNSGHGPIGYRRLFLSRIARSFTPFFWGPNVSPFTRAIVWMAPFMARS